MKCIIHIFVFLYVVFIASCSSETKSLTMPDIKGRPETVRLISDSWEKLLNHCPGINRYQEDLEYTGLNDTLDFTGLGETSRVDVEFRVSNNPKKIPNDFRARGHTCGFGIGSDGRNLRIQKAECTSVCLDRKYTDSGVDYVGIM